MLYSVYPAKSKYGNSKYQSMLGNIKADVETYHNLVTDYVKKQTINPKITALKNNLINGIAGKVGG
jgi:hypothetical protein